MVWRDFGRREIALWPTRAQRIFYGAIGLFVVDLGWYFVRGVSGLDALVFFLVAGACIYAAVRTWRDQHLQLALCAELQFVRIARMPRRP